MGRNNFQYCYVRTELSSSTRLGLIYLFQNDHRDFVKGIWASVVQL